MERIGHYKIVSELGRGGMGVVFKAHEESLNRFVAIKVLGEHLEEDGEYVERFVREAQSAAALSHPNIVQIYAISEDQGHHYFAMEYVQGTSVQRMIQTQGRIPPAEAARLIIQAASGLQVAHAQNVIHRDIKPANLMVTDQGLVKIADFGLALMGAATTRLTATGMLMGTPGYLSPEQCLDQSPDHRTDIYSLGVTFFEMVTGTMPFRADSPLALLRLIVEVEPPDIQEINPEVDGELRGIIATMLAKDRDDRYSNCAEVMADIQSWLEANGEPLQSAAGTAAGAIPPPPPSATDDEINTQPTVAVQSAATNPSEPPPTPPPAPAAVSDAPSPQATAPATQPPTSRRGSRTGLIAAAIAVVILGTGAVAAFLTVKSGVLDGIFNRGDTTVAELATEEEPSTSGADDMSAPLESDAPTEESVSDETAAEEAGAETGVLPVAGGSSPEAGAGHRTTAAPHQAQGSPKTTNIHREADARSTGSAPTPPPPKIVAPPPTATIVLAVGERLLAVEAEEYVKARLQRAGIEVLEVTSIPGLEGFTNTESRPSPEQVRDALRPYARYFLPLRVEYLGDRVISYMGQRDTVYQARVNMRLFDLRSGRPMGKQSTVKVEYTQINAGEVVARDLRKATTGIVRKLPRE